MKDCVLKAAKATDRFGGEINAVLNLGRIIWGLTSGRFASQCLGIILTLFLLELVEWNFAGCEIEPSINTQAWKKVTETQR